MGKIIEGLWDCPFCGNKRIRAGQKTCPDCGHPQDENTKFYMPDEIKYVSEEEAEKISRNPDWQCSFCGSLNSDDLNVCKNCGATKEDSERNYFEMRQQEEEKKRKKEEKKDKTIQENKKDERIANQVKNAFGKGVSNDGSRGDSDEGSGTQGNPFGNSSTGEITGVGGYGGYNLGGRGLVGSLPYPEYDNSNDAGIIAISITVDPQGKVISAIATVNGSKGTAFSNPKLRASAEAAARKSLFERSTGSSNQTGVIIYIFKQN